MKFPPVEQTLEIESSLPSAEAVVRLVRYLGQLGRRPVENRGLSGGAEIGSRIAYRWWGGSSRGVARLPISISWSARPTTEGSLVTISMSSNEGNYLFYTSLHERAFRRRFSALEGEFRARLA